MKKYLFAALILPSLASFGLQAREAPADAHGEVPDEVIAQQRQLLKDNTQGRGFGPQSPRDIQALEGNNSRAFGAAPAYDQMNLCNIHFHNNAEHKGGEFSRYAGNGDGHGHQTGYRYSGTLGDQELAPISKAICPGKYGSLVPGDTVEVHYVFSSAQVSPGPTLRACLQESINNPQLRVEAQVFVLVNDGGAGDFRELAKLGVKDGLHQALNIPANAGDAVQYSGSTTGPDYNEKGSPLQVSWRVRPRVAKVNIETVGQWCEDNIFDESYAHGVRNLVINPDLLSAID
ncbi:delta-class carbonic anhydrase [Marinobacterium sedimentorum]|uniref:delta-class carbonic anhydrase n=1 Tax=Marinobacterium sedimentorum TaxID=2927804 RepID=UPI0020C657F2|nr:delta-class carbonic anhydrase [Marinobacterium sedimentorum]MCP8686418.1 delta-class carbonic anhydrase [Marinobacterium sedimentorum]